ncbi:MAG: hypothetical protein FH761_17740 [Firmicutes bacterium]|nr:hypothetical protein [Bacillota bacterium]
MFDEPIKTFEQAKKYFKRMGFSHFHMAREYPNRYEEYKRLSISRHMEIEWRKEQLDEYYKNVIQENNDDPLWSVHSKMYELVESIRTDSALRKILQATQHISELVPFKDRVIIAETINGRRYRKFRSGLIYLAYDLGNISIAKAFVELSLHFASYKQNESSELERCQNSVKLCNDIQLELEL